MRALTGTSVSQGLVFRKPILVHKHVTVTLWWLATGAGYRTLVHLFGMSSSVSHCSHFCLAVNPELLHEYVKFLKGEVVKNVVRGLLGFNSWGFPQCAGAVDGSHISIIAPSHNPTDYFNRKGWHSVLLQGVVDNRL